MRSDSAAEIVRIERVRPGLHRSGGGVLSPPPLTADGCVAGVGGGGRSLSVVARGGCAAAVAARAEGRLAWACGGGQVLSAPPGAAALVSAPPYHGHLRSHQLDRSSAAGRVGLRAVDAKSLGALTAQAAYTAPLTLPVPIRARPGRLG